MPDFKNTVGGRFLTMLEAQAPANFAMVMSTGIVSVALHLLDYPIGARLLFWLNAALCVGLAVLLVGAMLLVSRRTGRTSEAGPRRHLTKRTWVSLGVIALAVPATILCGVYLLGRAS